MNVLVTGSSGFIGRNVANHFVDNGHNVYGISRSVNNFCKFNQTAIDITNKEQLQRFLGEKTIDVIIHCAAKAVVSDCEQDPYGAFLINSIGTASVLEAARQTGVKKIISIETDKVYGEQIVTPTPESAASNPNSPYELSKHIASEINQFYNSYYGLDVIGVRPANVLGMDIQNTTRLLPASFQKIIDGKGIPVYSSAVNMIRSFIYIRDVEKIIYLLATKPSKHSLYNLAAGIEMSILEFAERVNQVLTYDVPPDIINKEINFKEIQNQSIDGSLFTQEFEFEYTPFDDMIKESFEEFNKTLVASRRSATRDLN